MKHHIIRNFTGISLLLTISLCSSAAFAQPGAMRSACKADYQALCSNVQPGGGRVIACLHQNEAKLSAGCQKALASARGAQ